MLTILKKFLRTPFTPLNLITISKDRLTKNYQELSSINPKIKVAPVLKSNAYGHGIRLVGEILDEVNAPFLCVDSLYEAFQLKSKLGIKTPILIMGYIHPKSLSVKRLPFSFAVYDLEHAQTLNEYQKGSKVHIFVDSGMHREGVGMEELPEFLKKLKKLNNIEIEGLMSHLADPEKPDSTLTKKQLANFQKARKIVLENGFKPKWFHLGGSYGLLNRLTDGCNMVRVGRVVYGIDWGRPVLKHTSTIVQIKKIKNGDKVGYNGSFVADKDMIIGVLPLGYNDGVDRRLSNKGIVTIDGVECKVIGLISMNITTIDISDVSAKGRSSSGRKQPFIGQEAVIFSDNQEDPNSIVKLSKKGKILPHEILIHIAESTKRVVI